MSASEKLKQLDAAIPKIPWAVTPVTQLKAVADALPQIVAVVEAAETPLRGGVIWPEMDAALAALEEALS